MGDVGRCSAALFTLILEHSMIPDTAMSSAQICQVLEIWVVAVILTVRLFQIWMIDSSTVFAWALPVLLCCGFLWVALSAIKGNNHVPTEVFALAVQATVGIYVSIGQVSFSCLAFILCGLLPAVLLHAFARYEMWDMTSVSLFFETRVGITSSIFIMPLVAVVIHFVCSGVRVAPEEFSGSDEEGWDSRDSWGSFIGNSRTKVFTYSQQLLYQEMHSFATVKEWATRENRLPHEVMDHIGGYVLGTHQFVIGHLHRMEARMQLRHLIVLPSQPQLIGSSL